MFRATRRSGIGLRVNDRRAFGRRQIDVPVVAAASPEAVLPQARAVDISRGGLLMSFAEPLGFVPGHRMLVTVPPPVSDDRFWSPGHSRFHALASVVRCDRGDDFRTYVAVEFVGLDDSDYDELCRRVGTSLEPAE